MFSFGTTATSAPTTAGSLFNIPQAQVQPQVQFQPQLQSQQPLPSGGLFGTGQLQLQQPQIQFQSSLPTIAQPVTGIPYPKDTKFTDLPTDMRANLENIEKSLRQFSEQSVALSGRTYEATNKLVDDVESFKERVLSCENANETCRGHILAAKRMLNQYWKYSESVARMIMTSRQTGPDGAIKWVPVITPGDLSLLQEMMARLESQITEIIDTSISLAAQLDQLTKSNRFSVDMLKGSLKYQHDLFFGLSGRVANLQEELDRLKQLYRSFLGKYRSDFRDPFGPRTVGVKQSADTSKLQQPSSSMAQPSGQPTLPNALMTSTVTRPSFTAPPSNNPPVAPPLFSFNSGNNMFAKRASTSSVAQTPNPFLLQTPK